MKQLDMEKQAKDQINQNFWVTSSESDQTTLKMKVIRTAVPNHPSHGWLLSFGVSCQCEFVEHSVERLSKQGAGGKLCKGPPGQARSPEVGDGLFPDHPSDEGTNPVRFWIPIDIGTNRIEPSHEQAMKIRQTTELNIKTEVQLFNKNQNSNFLQTLNFTNMKKQILFLAFFVLAVLASITDSYGQDMQHGTVVPYVPASCTGANDSPLNPRPGKAYDYGVTIGNAGAITGVVNNYYWWATKDPIFVNGTATPVVSPNSANMLTVGGGLLATGANYASATGGTQTMSITWSPLTLANTLYQGPASTTAFPSPTFVAVMAQGACADNIQVFEINPQPAFTVDITNIAAGSATAEVWGNTISSCVSTVVSAVYNSGSNEVDMDYGKNTLYFEVVSANFVGSWTPTITIAGLNSPAETASVTIHDTWANAQTGANVLETLNYTADGTQVGAVALGTTASNTTNGVSMWLAVTVDHNTYENLAARPITVTIGGMDTTGTYDLADNCTATTGVDTDDFATQGITPRPDIDDTTGDPAVPVPQTFIIKTP